MPFLSKSQMRGAFSGAFGKKMKAHAKMWADETPNIAQLPEHIGPEPTKKKGDKSKRLKAALKKLAAGLAKLHAKEK